MSKYKAYFQVAVDRNIVKRAFVIAIVVGFILNAINQGEHIVNTEFDKINYLKIILTFLVPYIVSTYSSVFSKLSFVSGEAAGIDAEIICKDCEDTTVRVYKGEIIPYCSKCSKHTKWRFIKRIKPTDLLIEDKNRSVALFAELNPSPVVRINKIGKILEANSSAKILFGSYEIIGEDITKYLPGMSKIDYKKCIRKTKTKSYVEVINNKHFHLEILGIAESEILQIYGSDITHLVIANKKVESMAIFANVNPAPVLRFDHEGVIERANPAANESFNMKSVIGTNVKTLIKGVNDIDLKELIEGNKIESIICNINDKFYNLSIRGVSKLNVCFLYGSDITKQKSAEKEVHSMALFAEMNPEPVFRFDKSYKILQANPVANQVFPKTDIVGKNVKDFLPEVSSIDTVKFIKNNETRTIVEHVEDKIYRFMLRGISDLDICQIYGADITKRVKAEEEIKKQAESIQSSIRYAKRIQTAVLPEKNEINRVLQDHFVLFKPRDIVSGDFYWVKKFGNKVVAVAADSTGHGVPGAFVSMLGMSFLNEIVTADKLDSPGKILNKLRDLVKKTLSSEETGAADGMDIALSIIDKNKMELLYAGAYNPLYVLRKNELIEYKADRMPIGIYIKDKGSFTDNKVKIEKNDMIYMFSDGYHDQIGGEKQKKYSTRSFKDTLKKIHKKSTDQQKQILEDNLTTWMEGTKQIDDILVMGIKI